jgi:hypothetical protein
MTKKTTHTQRLRCAYMANIYDAITYLHTVAFCKFHKIFSMLKNAQVETVYKWGISSVKSTARVQNIFVLFSTFT